MTTHKELKSMLDKNLKDLSASPVEIEYFDNPYVIVKYEERDPFTGGHTHDYLYIICSAEDGSIIDTTSYYDILLAKWALAQKAMNNPEAIDNILKKFQLYLGLHYKEE